MQTDRKLYFLKSATDHLWLHPGMKTQYIMSWTRTLQIIKLHLNKREYVWSPATFEGDLWRYIAFNPNIDLVALRTVDIQKDICVIPFQMQVYFPRFSSHHSARFLQELFTERGSGQKSCFRSDVVLIYPLVVTNRGIMGHCLLKKPLFVPSVIFPSLSHYTSMLLTSACFNRLTWALRPLRVVWERLVFVQPAEICVLLFHRMSTWLDPSAPFWAHKMASHWVSCWDVKGIWQRMVEGKLLNICLCSAWKTWRRWRL